ncbi:hypothetical protein HZA87_02795 [Candidatus Uhrbacteria bacterium]|nr:hypothetical protein [Candidatus Uhrbacteria bacterium]
MTPGGPEAGNKTEVDNQTHEALTKQMEARLRSPDAVRQAIEMRTEQAAKAATVTRESVQKGVQNAATAEYGSLTQPPNDTADGRQAAVKAVQDALQGIADVVPNGTNDGVVVTLRVQLAPVAAGTEATDAQLKQVADKDRTALRVELNTAMEGMPANLRQAVTTTLDSLTAEQVQMLPAFVKTIREDANGALAVRVIMSLTAETMGQDEAARTKTISALRGANGQPVATAEQAAAISAFIGRLNPQQIGLIRSLSTGMATVENLQVQRTADKQLVEQAMKDLPRPMPALGTGARAMLEAKLQMSGFDVEACNLDATPPELRVLQGRPLDRALNQFMGFLAVISALGGGNRREAQTKVNATPLSPLERVAAAGQKEGNDIIARASPVPVTRQETINGTETTVYFFQRPSTAAGNGTEFGFIGNQWQWKTAGATNNWHNVNSGTYITEGVAAPEQVHLTTMNALATSLRTANNNVTAERKRTVEANAKTISDTLRGRNMRASVTEERSSDGLGHTEHGIKIESTAANTDIAIPAAVRTQLETLGAGTVVFEAGTGANNYRSVTIKNMTPERTTTVMGMLRTLPNPQA